MQESKFSLPANVQRLFTDPKFWFALYAVFQAIVLQVFPQIATPELLKLVDALVAITVAGLTGTQAVTMRLRARQARLRATHPPY